MKALLEFTGAHIRLWMCVYTSVCMHVSMRAYVHTGFHYKTYFSLCTSHSESRKKKCLKSTMQHLEIWLFFFSH